MFRQRPVASLSYQSGQVTRARLPNDAVYHLLQLSISGGSVTSTYTTGPSGPVFDSQFPFSLIRDLRIIRNGSDVVWQGSGADLAFEHHMLNNAPPTARLYNTASNVETLLTGSSRGVTIPANSSGIAANVLQFVGTSTASTTQVSCQFDLQAELWFQLNVEGKAATNTLVDARKLATFDIEILWATESAVMISGTNNTVNAVACTLQVMSTDQDSVTAKTNFGTFKRSAFQYSNIPYGSSNQQIPLSRGNYWYGMLIRTQAYKANSTVIPQYENAVLGNIQNRLNTNYQLRNSSFYQMQQKNVSDNGGRQSPFSVSSGFRQGCAAIEYCAALDNPGEMIPTYVTDVFDLLIETQAIGSSTNGVTTASTNPIINILTQEVIPGVTVSADAPQGAINGSIAATSAKPYSR